MKGDDQEAACRTTTKQTKHCVSGCVETAKVLVWTLGASHENNHILEVTGGASHHDVLDGWSAWDLRRWMMEAEGGWRGGSAL